MSIATTQPQAPQAMAISSPPVSVPLPDHPTWAMPLAVYERMVEAGLLSDHRDVYLWEGRLCHRMGIDRPHGLSVRRLFVVLLQMNLVGFEAETEMPLAFRRTNSAPQPDLKIVRGRCEDYNPHMPTTANVPMVIEVSDSTIRKDRALATSYAAEEIPVYWLLNRSARHLEVYSSPKDGVYTSIHFFTPAEDVPVVLDGNELGRIRVADLLP